MKILSWTLTYWNDAAMAARLQPGLSKWKEQIHRYLRPTYLFMSSGTWSDPALNPIPEIPLVNAGVRSSLPYDYFRRQYGICAVMGAAYHALNRGDWDLAVMFDWDALIGAVNFPAIFNEFMTRPEIIMAPGWYDGIGGPLLAWKPEGLSRLVHQRLYPNLCDRDAPERPLVWERECKAIYGNRWWNPWPQFEMLVYHDPSKQDPIAQDWPFVDRAPESMIAPYSKACTSRVIPLA